MRPAARPVTAKVSVSIGRAELRWARATSRRLGASVSALVSEALQRFRAEKARERAAALLLSRFGEEDRGTPQEEQALLEKWRA